MSETQHFYKSTTSNTPYTREQWLAAVTDGLKVQPPDWWFRSQKEQGRTTHAAASIWHTRYLPARRMVIWDMAPDEDFVARGYLR